RPVALHRHAAADPAQGRTGTGAPGVAGGLSDGGARLVRTPEPDLTHLSHRPYGAHQVPAAARELPVTECAGGGTTRRNPAVRAGRRARRYGPPWADVALVTGDTRVPSRVVGKGA